MDDDQKLAALKKVYTDVVLKITTETATRVLASEKKSAIFQHELRIAKEEGVRMLVRLKQMMDSQSAEAEEASTIQRKKIEELEAQLQEAEDIVKDLREELEDVQAKLERVKMENLHHMNELGDVCSTEVPMVNKVSSYQSSEHLPLNESSVALDVMVPELSQKNECLKCYDKTVCSCGVLTGNQDLSSIIVADKDPGLYRNGCTQRIRACETNVLDKDSCLLEESDNVKDKKSSGELKEAKQNPKEPALVAKLQSELEKKLLADINLGTSKSFSRRRKRASRHKKTILLLGGKQSHSSSKVDQLPEHSATNGPISVNDKAHSPENPSKIGPQLSRNEAEPKSQLNVRNIVETDGVKTLCEEEGEKGKMVPLKGMTEFSESSLSPKDVGKVDVLPSGSDSKLSDPTEGLTSQPETFLKVREIKYTYQRKRKREALSQSEVNGSHEAGNKMGDGKNDDQKLELEAGNKMGDGKKDDQKLAPEAGNKMGDGKNNNQKLEVKGDRKCSSEVIGSCGRKKKTGDGKHGVQKVEQPNSGWLEGSLREHKRMVQVARQLLSLSDERLWR